MRRQFKQDILITTYKDSFVNDSTNEFVQWLKKYMHIYQITAKQISQYGIPYETIIYWLKRAKRYPHIPNIKRLCLALSIITNIEFKKIYTEILIIIDHEYLLH